MVELTHLPHVSLFGVGLVLRRSDMLRLLSLPHFLSVAGPTGNRLSRGDDYEMCYLLALIGRRLFYTSRLRFTHIIPKSRWEFSCLERLMSNREHLRRI
jgi:hypothetical protein